MDSVKVQSLDTLKVFRAVLLKFAEGAQTVLSEGEGELQRTLNWLETEAVHYWQGQIHNRQAAVTRAKDALRAKKLFRPDGSKASVVDEEKALRQAIARLEEARQKLANVHKYRTVLQKEMHQYKGQVQRFANAVAIDIPIAVGRIDALVRKLEQYLAVRPVEAAEESGFRVQGSGEVAAVLEEGVGSMARAEPSSDKETEVQHDRGAEVTSDPESKIQNPKSKGEAHGSV